MGHPLDADEEGGLAIRNALALLGVSNRAVGSRHDLAQLFGNALRLPVLLVEVLRPLEVGHDDASSIHQDVGHDRYASVVEYVVGLWGYRVVGLLVDDSRLALGRRLDDLVADPRRLDVAGQAAARRAALSFDAEKNYTPIVKRPRRRSDPLTRLPASLDLGPGI